MVCTRASVDPVAQAFLREYNVNLLKWPREKVEIASVLVGPHGGPVRMSVSLADIFGQAPDLTVSPPGALADSVTSFTSDLDVGVGVGLLGRVAKVLGLDATAGLQSSYARAKSVTIRIRDAERQSVDLGELSSYLSAASIDPAQTLFTESDRLVVITALMKATSIDIAAKSDDGGDLGIDVESTELAKAGGKLKASRYGSHALNYKAERPLVFGVELMQIDFEGGAWRLRGVEKVEQVRGDTHPEFSGDPYVFLGGHRETGDLFVSLAEEE